MSFGFFFDASSLSHSLSSFSERLSAESEEGIWYMSDNSRRCLYPFLKIGLVQRPARPSPRVGDSRGCCPAPVCDARGPKEPPAGADPGPRGASGTRGAPPPTCPSLLPRSQQGSYYVCKAHFERGTKICLFCKTQPCRARKFRGAVLWLPSSAPLGCRGEGPSVVSARLRCAPTAAETPPGTYLRGVVENIP